MKRLLIIPTILIFGCFGLQAQTIVKASEKGQAKVMSVVKNDITLIEEAVMDYVMGLYDVDTTRIYKSVHPDLKKRGFWLPDGASEFKGPYDMSFQQLVDLASKWNAKGDQADENSPREIKVLDVLDKTACARVNAAWGVDFFHLAKMDGKWYIMNVLWQSYPTKEKK
ncbi:MAG: hypothetical protein DHS20C18_11460 [Saprospiraceae bacterium]|nr:MAG: hypothetical protein DHS20C18_11460 [Saprospiraceae bacterium]